jgi:hypothetical protein
MIDPLTRTVMNIIRQFGGTATMVVKTGEDTYDPETSTTIPGETQLPIKMVAQDYIQKTNGLMTQTGGLIQTGDKQFFIQADAGVPPPRPGVDAILFEGRKWTVLTLKDYNPSGSKSYCYEVYARV